jgi:tetratricopeptide (TPR) repeat protein
VQTNEAGAFDARRAEDGYAAAFRSYGLDLNQRTPEEAAERIRASAVREQLLASLDDWIYVQTWHKGAAPVDTARLRTCVRLADDDARRQQFRDLADRQDAPKLKELARDPKMLDEPPLTLVLLGMNLGDATAEETLLRRARLRYPSDFWLSYELARVLDKQTGREKETLECYWTALALRPQNEGIYCEICPILKTLGKLDEAADVAAKAVQINGDSSDAHFQLGGMLERRGEIAEAVAEYQKAIQLRQDESRNGNLHWNIALLRLDQGRREEARQEFDLAAEAYRRESDQDPDDAGIHCDLGQALLHEGRFGEAVQCLRRGDELSARQNVQETSCQWRQEAERQVILDSLLPAVLKGEAAPIDSAAEAALAETAQMSSRRLFAASTRLYSQAFAADPTLEGQLGAVTHNGYRYDAACAAALAAAAQGEDAHGLSAEERDALRRQAVNWLRAELNELAPVAAPANTAAVLEHPELIWYIHRTLKIWQGNADLAVLRDEAALAGLPQEGREECRKLWAGVEALAARTAPAK